ncbi:MAG: hypothetical protein JWN18_412 [Parcubacteria group bacterium]|nr:hypothetical protein [Parcubacteria group bacterium]
MNLPSYGLDPQLSEAIFGTIREPMVVLSEDLHVIVASRAFYEKFQTPFGDAEGKLFYELGNGQWNVPRLRTLLEEVIPKKSVVRDHEVEHVFDHLGKRIMLINAREIVYENGLKKMLLSILDVTELRAGEEHKLQLMEQKDTLLKEMRHRIANSLQLIASIILLKAHTVPSEESRMHLEDAHDRILSIATVQRNLDPTDSGAEVPITEYLRTLCSSLAKSMIGGRKPIQLVVQGDASTVTPDEAISLGLMTTELVINSLKHAFPSGEGNVTVSYHTLKTDWILVIKDDGVGYSLAVNNKEDGLGTSIIESLANQMKATIKRESSHLGTTVSVGSAAT